MRATCRRWPLTLSPDWFTPFVLQQLGGPAVTFSIEGSPALAAFMRSRIAWVDQLTGLTFTEAPDAKIQIRQVAALPDGIPGDGLSRVTDTENIVYVTADPLSNRAQFVAAHELGHALGLAHPYGDGNHPTATNQITIMSGTKSPFNTYRTTFSPLDVQHLQQAHGAQVPGPATEGPDVLIGGPGPQRLRGRGGADWLIGGGGQDVFVLERPTAPAGWDVIEDFGQRDRVRWRGPGELRVRQQGQDHRLYFRGELVGELPRTPFFTNDHIL